MSDSNSISAEYLAKIQTIFDAAVELSVEQRPRFLDESCRSDAGLRAEVVSLLASYDEDPDYLERETDRVSSTLDGVAEPEAIGPYRILDRIGQGGMGAVYLAERDDGQYRHRVAVKLLRRGLDTEQILGRFRAERQILANLDHPRIVRLLDGGVSEDGRPYFVMEHIGGGVPIDRYCDENRLSVRRRLHLFRQVCEAVQHAHQKLIVHRDLKPANLLVSEDGQVKLLDFGIAKLLAPELADVTALALTRPEMRLLTPEYASPEQLRGEPLTAASDVYALGVVLYELLTGHRPHSDEKRTPVQRVEAICETEPEKPSLAASRRVQSSPPGDTLADPSATERPKALVGDLDNIVLKALRIASAERYQSVEALAADVDRYLERRPVLARPQTVGYRLRRFTQRNAGAVAAAVAIIASLAVGLASTIWQGRAARIERDRARLEAERAEQVTDVMVDLFDLSDPVRNADADNLSVRDFADLAQDQLVDDLAEQPELLARMQTAIGRVNINLGRPAEAVELLEEALAIQRRAFAEDHLDLAATLHWLGRAREETGELEIAEGRTREALSMRRAMLGEVHPLVAETLNQLGTIVGGRGDLNEAEAHLEAGLAIRRTVLGQQHEQTAASLSALAVVFYERGDYDRAESGLREAIRIKEEALGTKHSAVADGFNDLGAILYAKQEFRGSLEAHRRALDLRLEILGEHHPLVALSQAHIGNVQHLLGDTVAAVEYLESSLAVREAAFGIEHPAVAFSLKQLGRALTTRGEYPRAKQMLRRAVEIDRRAYGDGHRLVANGLSLLGRLHFFEGQKDEAIAVLRDALRIRRSAHGSAHLNTAATETLLARALLAAGEESETERLLAAAHATYDAIFPDGHLFSAPAHLASGDLLLGRGETERAEARYRQAVELRRRKLPDSHWLVAEAESRLALCLSRRGDTATAIEQLRSGCRALGSQVGSRHPSTRLACGALSDLET